MSNRVRCVCDCAAAGDAGKSRCRQSESEATDLNVAVRRYRKSGVLTGCMASTRKAIFGDFSMAPDDFLSAQVRIANANQAFLGLPARVRERFENDPVKLLMFLADSANIDEAVKLGLAVAPEPKAGTKPVGEAPIEQLVDKPVA